MRRIGGAAVWLLMAAGAVLLAGCSGDSSAESFTFAAFGDCRPGTDPYSPVLLAMAQDMALHKPAFIVGTGDYIEGSSTEATVRRQYDGFFTALAPLQSLGTIPVALAPGNHEIRGSRRNQELFEEYFKHRYFSFDHGGSHFIILDSEEPGLDARIGGDQLVWLKDDLARHRSAKLCFVSLHRPLYPVDGHKGGSMDKFPAQRDALHELFVAEGVDCVLSGHEHLFNQQRKDGIEYIITGGAGAPLYASVDEGGFYHYLLVHVTGHSYRMDLRRPVG